MAAGVGFVLGLVAVVVFLQHAAAAPTAHIVGDTTGWTVPQGGVSYYSNWASKNNFVVGDSLTFNFETNEHDVLKVTKESFDACNSNNAIGNIITKGPATVKLDAAHVHYFICTVGRHCQAGQKLSVTVSATPNGAMPPSRAPPTSGSTPSHDDACAPTQANSPSSTPRTSSSAVIMATGYVTLSAIVLSLLF